MDNEGFELNPGDACLEVSTQTWPVQLVVITLAGKGQRASWTFPPSQARAIAASLLEAAEAVENADPLNRLDGVPRDPG